jgi:hypothetical protein
MNDLVNELLGNSRLAQKTNEKGNENMGMSHVCDGIKRKDREELSNKKAGPIRASFVLLHVLKMFVYLKESKDMMNLGNLLFILKLPFNKCCT